MSGISGALAAIAFGISAISQQPHWALEEPEADTLAKSIANVARHYPKVASSQKMIDWTMLMGALGMVAVPRIMMTRELMETKRKEKAANV